jgi:uncharacterized membrane protein YhaH (DUF805 family)
VIVASVVARVVDGVFGIQVVGQFGPLYLILCLALLVPSVAVSVRRLHDTNRTGWWVLLPLVPYVLGVVLAGAAMGMTASENALGLGTGFGMGAGFGAAMIFMLLTYACLILLVVFYCMPGTPGDNRYGPDPYGEGAGKTVAAE